MFVPYRGLKKPDVVIVVVVVVVVFSAFFLFFSFQLSQPKDLTRALMGFNTVTLSLRGWHRREIEGEQLDMRTSSRTTPQARPHRVSCGINWPHLHSSLGLLGAVLGTTADSVRYAAL